MLKEQKCHQSFLTFSTISGEEWPEKKLQQLEASAIPGPKKSFEFCLKWEWSPAGRW